MQRNHSRWTHRSPVDLILDTDMGNDIDDALALAMIHALQSRGECRLLGVMVSKDHPLAPVFVDVVNTFYGRGDIPIGMVKDGVTPDERTFLRVAATGGNDGWQYPRTRQPEEYPEAVALLRQLLASRPDGSVTLVMIGFSTNVARLLDTPRDEYSPLDGTALVASKLRGVVAMAADFSTAVQANPTLQNREYNIHRDVDSAKRFFHRCPVPVLFSGYEIGSALPFPGRSIEDDYGWCRHHPVADSYRAYLSTPYDRPTWDLTAVLAAVRAPEQYFGVSGPGRVRISDDGIARFAASPEGRHSHLILDVARSARALDEMVGLCAQPICHKLPESGASACDRRCSVQPGNRTLRPQTAGAS